MGESKHRHESQDEKHVGNVGNALDLDHGQSD
jgi:hypothetical protein